MSRSPAHDSAHLHVSGRALYADDIPLPPETLHAAFGLSSIAHGRVLDGQDAVQELHQRHLGAQPGEDRGEFHADGASRNRVEAVISKREKTP